MSDEWMKTSFFPLLPLDPDETPAATPSTTSYSAPLQTSTSSSIKLSSKSLCTVPTLPTTDPPSHNNSSSTSDHDTMASLLDPDPSAADVQQCASASPLSNAPSAFLVEPSMADSSGLELSSVELVMFNKIISSGCIIKSQQRGDPDFSHSQLCSELMTFLQQKPGSFLMRYGKYLDCQDLTYFDGIPQRDDFEVNFRLGKLRQTLSQSSKSRTKKIRNRRYECLRYMMEESSYFSEEEMRQRNPLLYDFYIGQYLSEEEKQRRGRKNTDMALSAMILNQMDQDKTAELFRRQTKSEIEELSLSNATGCESSGCESRVSSKKHRLLKAMELNSDPTIADREKYMLKQEFLAAMQTHFLDGKDEGFDYSRIENDEQYDSLDMRERDEQDEYFDEEEPSWNEEECDESNMEVT